ncbi:MAG: hypothetical protein NZM43_12245 [Saprospiraceae bacterium]|nr:hypothetical protein [Saprospiraceae bacterium]MDW8485082.1 hypothetical protein [Saprospiraceae bacterium]
MATKAKSEQDAQRKGEEVSSWQKEIAENYTYCMFSTLNQMVNYLPMLLFDFKKPKIYVTLEGDPQNKQFDENLKRALDSLPKQNSARFHLPSEHVRILDVNNVDAIREVLGKEANGKRVLWNITGGQRPFVMAVFELLKEANRKDDIVMYLEGNAGQLTFLRVNDEGKLEKIPDAEHGMQRYNIANNSEYLTLSIALKLMGFEGELSETKPTEIKESSSYLSLAEKYVGKEHLRKKLLGLNKSKDYFDQRDNFTYLTKSVLSKEPKNYFSELDEEVELILAHGSHARPFGYLLEKMFACKIWSVAKDYIAKMAVNVRLYYDDAQKQQEAEGNIIDELDIVVLTRTGQLVVFEVKSGEMSGDVAKSTKYTTYAIAGVYGKPVLLTPLLKEQINKLNDLSGDWAYGASVQAARAARRAQLPILALDGRDEKDFETALKEILNIR